MANYQLTAKDIMQVEIATILADASITEAAEQMRYEGVRSLIVVPRGEGDPHAIITYSDVVNRVLAKRLNPSKITVQEVMTKPLVTIPLDMPVEYIAKLFSQTGIGHVPVLHAGELRGIVSMTDLVTEVVTMPA